MDQDKLLNLKFKLNKNSPNLLSSIVSKKEALSLIETMLNFDEDDAKIKVQVSGYQILLTKLDKEGKQFKD